MPAAARPPDLPRCYVASPFGFTEAGRDYYRRIYLPALSTVVDPVDPWALTSAAELSAAVAEGRQSEIAVTIGRRNAEAIRSCALLAAYLDGQEPDSGTVSELGFAAGLGLACFGLRSDLRRNGEAGAALNLQVQAFIIDSGGTLAAGLQELVDALGSWTG
jgi:nucleoside 2-deoxyribosyltransferase